MATLFEKEKLYRAQRKGDPYLDRRSGEDRRQSYSLAYFSANNPERRVNVERRSEIERRTDCVRVDKWSSVCPEPE